MGGKSGQTIGFHYIMTVLAGFGRGPENGVLAVEVDDKLAWFGERTDSTPTAINKPNLFGGEKKEGGIQGGFRWFSGARDQVLPGPASLAVGGIGPVQEVTIPDIKAAIGGRVSEMRGFTTFLYRGLVCSMNPYPKEWHFLRWRTTAGWFNDECWYPEKATIWMSGDGHPLGSGGNPTTSFGEIIWNALKGFVTDVNDLPDNKIRAMNPAHIIYQALTDPQQGAARSAAELDENSFILAANTLCTEGFGLCVNWARQEDVDAFIQVIIDHIVAVLYTDRSTGKQVLKLIRNDYDPDEVPLYDANSGLLEIEEDDSAAGDEAINEIILKGRDQSIAGRGKDFEVRAHNNGTRGPEGAISDSLSLPYIPTRSLGLRRAQMELRTHAPGLKRFRLKLDRRAWKQHPGGVIRIAAPGNDIGNMILRLAEIDHGTSNDTAINARAVEDMFGLPSTTFQTPVQTGWEPPADVPEPAAASRLLEAGYRDMIRAMGETNAQGVDPSIGYIGQLAMSPGYSYQYDLASKTTGETAFVVRTTGSFTYRALLATNVDPLDTVLTLTTGDAMGEMNVGEALMIGNEIVRIDAKDTEALTITVARGCADTIPAAHATGDAVWTLDDDLESDQREYAVSEVVQTKVLTRTSNGLLDPDDAPTESVTIVARHDKPYPPGDVTVDGVSIYALSGDHPEPEVDWAHRDRLSQSDQLIEHEAGDVGPEAGVTYTIRVKSADGLTTLRTTTAIPAGPWTYDASMQSADGSPDEVLMELESVRDGVASWQKYSFRVTIVSFALMTQDGQELLTQDGLTLDSQG